jgi:amidase
MARSVEDAALLLNVIAGYDAADWAYGEFASYAPAAWMSGTPVPDAGTVDYTRALDPNGLKGARIGVCRSLFGFDPSCDELMETAIQAMRDAGAEIIDELYIGAVEILADGTNEYTVLVTEFAHGIQEFITGYMPDGPITSLADIVDFNYEHADRELLYGDQAVLEEALNVGTVWDEAYQSALTANLSLSRDEGIDQLMDEHQLDALIAPTAGIPTPLDPYGDVFMGSSARLAAVAGYPSITVPIGQYNAMPAGMHLFGRAFSEETLIKLAFGLEQTLQARETPTYLEEPPLGDTLPSPEEESFPVDDSGEEWIPEEDGDGEWVPPDESEEEWVPPGE